LSGFEVTPTPDSANEPTGEFGRDEKRTGTQDAAKPMGLSQTLIVVSNEHSRNSDLNQQPSNTGSEKMGNLKREVHVFRRDNGYQVHDKGVIIFKSDYQGHADRKRLVSFLKRFNLQPSKGSVSRYSWLRDEPEEKVKTRFGSVLTAHQEQAYWTLKKLIEKEESFFKNRGMADAFRSYFNEG
jgi:hypothetical protein